jgi:hypothetical protein
MQKAGNHSGANRARIRFARSPAQKVAANLPGRGPRTRENSRLQPGVPGDDLFRVPGFFEMAPAARRTTLGIMSRSFETVVHLAMFTVAIAVIVAVMVG